MSIRKKRIIYFLLILLTIPLGLASRKYGVSLPTFIADYAGDTLYAVCAFWIFRFLLSRHLLVTIALITLAFCIVIETIQLYQAPWIQSIRQTSPFGLLLGYGFLWSDLICYAVGTLIAFVFALLIERFYTHTEFK
jgi:hypothetical protein